MCSPERELDKLEQHYTRVKCWKGQGVIFPSDPDIQTQPAQTTLVLRCGSLDGDKRGSVRR